MSVTMSMAVEIVKLVPFKLNRDNYFLWKSLLLRILGIHDLLGFVDGSNICPEKFLVDKEGKITVQIDPKFTEWNKQDQILLICLNATISESILPYVIENATSRDLWIALEERFGSRLNSRRLDLKCRLLELKKKSLPVTEYLKEINEISDNLASIGSPVDDSDLVVHMLLGLPSDYDAFSNVVMERPNPVTPDELHRLFLKELNRRRTKDLVNSEASNQDKDSKNPNYKGNGGGR